jgi:aminoglycoside phosphotransferase (APT) family kinase protein
MPPSSAQKPTSGAVDPDLRSFLIRSCLAQPQSQIGTEALPGGVSCDVWKVVTAGQTYCVKRALPRLRVAKLWEAPITRSEAEWNWLNFASSLVPEAAPQTIAHDAQAGMIAIEYLDPQRYPVWKQLLLDGIVDPAVAAAVGHIIGRIHAASARNSDIASQFRTGEAFYALRIEPYLFEAARRNPCVANSLHRIAKETLQTEIVLVHGDLSPKNILLGPVGPVILDAETAWYGDPAFDVAFCLNHLLLKCVARPRFADAYLGCFHSLRDAYLSRVSWEHAAELETRATHLLPALLLARVDGKSPVEYLTEPQRLLVRDVALQLIRGSSAQLGVIAQTWKDKITPLRAGHPQAG